MMTFAQHTYFQVIHNHARSAFLSALTCAGLLTFMALPASAQVMDIPLSAETKTNNNASGAAGSQQSGAAGDTMAAMPRPDSEDEIVDVALPSVPVDPTHPILRLTPDKAEIITLDKPVKSFVIGNEDHLGLFMDSARRLILIPRVPGATFFTALGQDGRVVMQRHVIVAGPKENYVRVRRSCALSSNEECQSTQIYYCPDMCHNVSVTSRAPDAPAAPPTSSAPPTP